MSLLIMWAGMGLASTCAVDPCSGTMRRGLAGAALRVVPIGDVDIALAETVAGEVGALLGVPAVLGAVLSIGAPAPDSRDKQYPALHLLKALRAAYEIQGLTLGITGLDLSYPGLNYVFGLADDTHPVAVISTARFAGGRHSPHSEKGVAGRTVKTAVHELGHLLGLSHCKDRRCVMFFSHNLSDTDHKGKAFCAACGKAVGSILRPRQAGEAGLYPA